MGKSATFQVPNYFPSEETTPEDAFLNGEGATLVEIGEEHMQPLFIDYTSVCIRGIDQLPSDMVQQIHRVARELGITPKTEQEGDHEMLVLFEASFTEEDQKTKSQTFTEQMKLKSQLGKKLGTITRYEDPKQLRSRQEDLRLLYGRFTEDISFKEINKRAVALAQHIQRNRKVIIAILREYESYEVADDEVERTLHHLTHLTENQEYFQKKIGGVAAFLPSNQPLYALTCFGIVPSYMAERAHVKAPEVMKEFFGKLVAALDLPTFAPNVKVTEKDRAGFVEEVTSERRNPRTERIEQEVDLAIFTGTEENAKKMRENFTRDTLFITNGAGHNPIVVAEDADLRKAVEAVIAVQFYNSGQDCAAPSAVLVHAKVHDRFMQMLRKAVSKVRSGPITKWRNRVGPITRKSTYQAAANYIHANGEFEDSSTSYTTDPREQMIKPTIFDKPLDREKGGNFTEWYAPIVNVHKYTEDEDLEWYFGHKEYYKKAMYITVHGSSKFVESLVHHRTKDGKRMHDPDSIRYNTHLHAKGQEEGTKEYGGRGPEASSITIFGKTIAMPTLPQRDIFRFLVQLSQKCIAAFSPEQAQKTGITQAGSSRSRRMSRKMLSKRSSQVKKKPEEKKKKEALPIREKPNANYIDQKLTATDKVLILRFRECIQQTGGNVGKVVDVLDDIIRTTTPAADQAGMTPEDRRKALCKHINNLFVGQDIGPAIHVILTKKKPYENISTELILQLLDVGSTE